MPEFQRRSKVTKASVDYSAGMPNSHCSLCQHFRLPDRCTRVEGDIKPSFWCRLFVKKTAAQ